MHKQIKLNLNKKKIKNILKRICAELLDYQGP
jgi:hypothetical protein